MAYRSDDRHPTGGTTCLQLLGSQRTYEDKRLRGWSANNSYSGNVTRKWAVSTDLFLHARRPHPRIGGVNRDRLRDPDLAGMSGLYYLQS
jgi:hypothetical protein